jgi:DNA-binding transcriptional regulator YiaG
MKQQKRNNEPILKREKRAIEFRKESVDVWFHFYEEPGLALQYTTTELDELNMTQVLNKYREIHNLPFPEEIRAIRQKYDLSASKMSDILGFGANTYRQYEAGEVPSGANAKLIRMAEDPQKFLSLVGMCEELDSEYKKKLESKIKALIEADGGWTRIDMGDDPFAESIRPSIHTGYKKPDIKKFANVIKRVAEKAKPFKTSLNKILFYIDFAHYKKNGFAITGCQYSAIQMGPVPNWFETTYEKLAEKNEFEIHYHLLQEGNFGVQFKARKDNRCDEALFTQEEIQTMDEVINLLGKKRAKELIDTSHEEIAWIKNHKDKKVIAYDYAFELKAL